MVAEGYYAAASAIKINDGQTHIPIIEAVHKILYQGEAPEEVFAQLSEELS